MSNTYGAPAAAPMGGNLTDLVSTQKGGVQSLSVIGQSVTNALPPATQSSSPVATGINNLGTTATSVIASSAFRHGITFHNPATANVNVYVFPSTIATTPTLAAPGGAWLILPGADLPLPSIKFTNANCGFSAFVSTGTTGALTIWEFL